MNRIALVMASLLFAGGPAAGQTWDASPLRSPTPIPRDGLPADRAGFFQWLGTLTVGLEVERARERIYTYVSDAAKRSAGAFPERGDADAILLFRSAARLGVAGADQVLARIDSTTGGQRVAIPAGLTLSLESSNFALGSDDSTWAVCFPYYFMPSLSGRHTPGTGVVTDIATISTLAAQDSGTAGSSQATILLLAAPTADSSRHVAFWTQQLDVRPWPAPSPAVGGQWFRGAPGAPMRREAVAIRLPERIVLLAYLGLPGTFEVNRPHFLDVVRTVAPRRCAASGLNGS